MKLAFSIVTLLSIFVIPNTTLSAPSVADGKTLYSSCAACHGAKGEGNRALGAPNIAGMDAWYLKTQLENFSTGKRGTKAGDSYGAQMRAGSAAANTLANRAAIATYISKMPKVAMAAKSSGKPNLANGSTQYNALCSACHNANGKGNQALGAPRLVGLDNVYLSRQYSNFRTGLRGYHANDKFGKQMAAISKMLDAKAEPDVFAYINTLKP
jgi:cytochrome c oxidase subunit 2